MTPLAPTSARRRVYVRRGDEPLLVDRARSLCNMGGRRLLGITGAPGAGKSFLAEAIVDALAPAAVLVPMDGFHLAEAELERLGIHERKGAVDTFDAGGFVALLRRIKEQTEPVVYAPTFRRDVEEPIAGAIAVASKVPLVVVEGNYLLVGAGAWASVRSLLDEAWFLEPDEATRVERLTRRHIAFGRDERFARQRALGTDQQNAEVIMKTRERADVVVVG